MAQTTSTLWVRIVLSSGTELTGGVQGASGPADLFRTQLVRVDGVRERSSAGKLVERDQVHVNRDRIELVEVMADRP